MKEDFWVAEPHEEKEPSILRKRKRRFEKRRIEFLGWGSRPLIEFLEAMGEDTSTERTRHEVVILINKYVKEKGLACPKKKKKINCDEIIYRIFGKRAISRAKVHSLLEDHFAVNRDSSDDGSPGFADEDGLKDKKKVIPQLMKKAPESKPKSCFAAIVAENIKLVYLKKSLVEELLLEDRESFDSKLVGSFVRMKCDPNDIFQKNPFQLQLVTGIERIDGNEILIKVSNFFKDIPISMLSDGNFEQEEVEDVNERVKGGLLKKLLLTEVESKAATLHHDITKHWIAKELKLLKNRIEHANIKGWRKQLWEFREQKKMLETPLEVEKMLNTVPEVIAEELPVDNAAAVDSGDILTESGDILTSPLVTLDDSRAQKVEDAAADITLPVEDQNDSGDILTDSGDIFTSPLVTLDNSHAQKEEDAAADSTSPFEDQSDTKILDREEDVNHEDPAKQVIDLSSSDDDDDDRCYIVDEKIWHYLDPKGALQGPFSLNALKRWSDAKYFDSGFRIWRSGQSSVDGVLLMDVLRRAFPC